ncbi:L-alanine-DL-glutamate epimerase-like enolase superfamily enzyme [Microbacterium murale]|uniref:L-alanine-DL-glutamate epimerase-like enolase superfamily enzyme n=1 Tax=Microbacterium murale TaxID=1081040 RepID=A0ABU0P7Y0_9MICO|nr:L-alanine-DL-glutamate epimerase-like enolase superfamily enzyme [Microbacterium murale]
MKLLGLRLHHLEIPLVSPFTTSFMTQTHKRCFLVEAQLETDAGDVITGWGENVALDRPYYSAEYLDGSADVVERWIAPLLFDMEHLTAETVFHHLRKVIGNPMAKASVEMAILDAQLRAENRSFASYLGAVSSTVPSGVSVGIQDSVTETLGVIGGYLEQGYARIKLKIQPGADIAHVAAVRREFGDDLLFQVDANAAYTLVDAAHLRRLDDYGLLLIEQPLGEGRHPSARAARRSDDHADLSGRIDRVGRGRRRCDLSGGDIGDQHQARPRRRLSRGEAHPRPRAGARHRRLVRRHARDRHRKGRECRTRRSPRLHAPR